MLRLPLLSGVEWACPMLPASVGQLTQTRGRRRTTNPPPWLPPVYEKNRQFLLDEENKKLLARLQEVESQRVSAVRSASDDASRTANKGAVGETRRLGLIVRKIGMLPQWTNQGERLLCTMLEVPSNHVISVTSPEEWFRRSLVGKRKAFNRAGPMWRVTVGAVDSQPNRFTAAYRAQFAKAGVPVKEKLGAFLVSEDALPQVGDALDIRHFNCGQYVTATGKTIDWGFQGGMHRWGMRGQPQRRTTKSHRRIGSVGSVSDARIWPGKRMPGHMGWEWRTLSGVQIVRMNLDKQVIYIKGNVPGDVGEMLLLKDCLQVEKRAKDVWVPTWYPTLEAIPEETEGEEAEGTPTTTRLPGTDNEVAIEKLFRFTSPTLTFADVDTKRSTARDKTKAKIAKVKK